VIASGHAVTLTGAETINDLTINNGGIFNDDNKGDITVDGNLVLNGTKTGQKNIQFTGGSGQTIDGTGVHSATMNIKINGDASILSTASLTIINNIALGNGVTATNNGTITINGSITGAMGTWVNAANSSLTVATNLLTGGGTLTAIASGNTVVYNKSGAQNIKTPTGSPGEYYNLTIEGTGTKTIQANLKISGSLTITSGTLDTDAANDFDLNIGGDFTNSGTFNENLSTVTFDGTGSQTITNSSGETFYDLTINKSSGTLTLANDVTTSNILTMTVGTIDAGSNTLTLGTGTGNEGTYSYTAGQIIGQFERWIANTTTGTDIDFPVGTSSNSRIATINFSGINVGGTVLFKFVDSDPGNSGLSLVDGAVTIYNTFVDGYWDMTKANSFNLGGANDFNLNLSGTGFTAFTIDANTRLLTRTDAGSNWTAEGTHAPAVDPIAKRTGLSTMGAQYAFGDDTNCTGPTTSAITGSTEVCTSDTGEAYSVTDNSNIYTWTITGGTQVTGGTTASITVDWGATGQVGNVRVVETNGCTSGSPVDLAVNINSIAPTSITGKTSVAESTADEPYSVTDLGYTYTWNITGGTLDTGQGTSSITVDWGTSGMGNVSVVAQKTGCTAAVAFDIDVTKYIVINSAQNGNWGTASTWVTAAVPLSTESARVLNGHTVTLTASETINNFIIDAGGIATTTNKKLTVDGDVTINGFYIGGTFPLVFDGANATIDGVGRIILNSGVDVDISNGNKTIASTAVLQITSGDLDIAAGITVTNNGSISVTEDILDQATSVWTNSTSSTLIGGAAVLANGTLNASATGNTVEYNATAAQTIKNPSSSTYYNLTLSGSGTKTAPASLDINGDLTISGTAELDISANTADLTIAGDYSNSGGTFTEGTQTVTFDGIAGQTITNTAGETFYNLTVNKSSGSLTLDQSNSTDVNIASGGTLTLTSGIVNTTSTELLTVLAGGSSSGGTSSSFVDGPMKKIGNTDFTFPVGDASTWAPLGISNLTGDATTEFTTQYFKVDFGDNTVTGALNNASTIEYWDLTRAVTASAADVTLHWKSAASSGIDDHASGDLVVGHYDGTDWESFGQSSIVDADPGSVTASGVSSFGSFTFGSLSAVGNPLPIELTRLKAYIDNNLVRLEWETASETNNDFFTVEKKSSEAINFEKLTIVQGAGNSTRPIKYSIIDDSPIKGISYYRLKQTDFDGSSEYSGVISVQYNPGEEVFNIYPNPINRGNSLNILINYQDMEEGTIDIYSILGELIFHNPFNQTNNKFDLPTSLESGTYIIHISNPVRRLSKLLLVK